jgi:hypothetical protein
MGGIGQAKVNGKGFLDINAKSVGWSLLDVQPKFRWGNWGIIVIM